MIPPYIVLNVQLERFAVLSSRVNGFAPITKRKAPEVVTGPLSSPDGVDRDTYCRTSGQDSAFATSPVR